MRGALIFVLGAVLDFIARGIGRLRSEYRGRKYRGQFGKCGAGVYLNGLGFVSGAERIEVGANVHIGNGYFIRGEGGLTIGDNTHVSRDVIIYTVNHEYEGARLPYDEQVRLRPVSIGKNVWVGARVTVLPGAHVGDGAVIGAGAVVAGKVEPLSICVAQKAAPLARRNEAHYSELEKNGNYGGVNGQSVE